MGLELFRRRALKGQTSGQAKIQHAAKTILISGRSALIRIQDAFRADAIQPRGEHVGRGPRINQRFLFPLSQQGADAEIQDADLIIFSNQ